MLANLPDIQFVDTDASKVEDSVITTYEAIAEKKLYPGDPVRLFLEALAYIVAQQRFVIDYSAKQNLLAYSENDHLGHLGILTDTQRLPARAAATTMQFSIAESLGSAVLIPQGTRVTPGDQVYFATDESAEIPSGETTVTVSATCQDAGASGNGFVAGQINRMVDPVSHITSVSNTTMSLGGADQESDDNFRQRIQLSPEKYSNAGPELSYKYWALKAHQDILDATVVSPGPGKVDVYALMQNGELPGSEILQDIYDQVGAEKRRPLTDEVNAYAPEQVAYNLDVTYYINAENSYQASKIQTAVQEAVDAYVAWQKAAIGRDINPSELIRRVQQAGAKRVAVSSPDFQALDLTQVAADSSITVTYGGLEDA